MEMITRTTLGYTRIVCYKNKIYYKLYNYFFSLCKYILNINALYMLYTLHILQYGIWYVHTYIHTYIHTYQRTYIPYVLYIIYYTYYMTIIHIHIYIILNILYIIYKCAFIIELSGKFVPQKI